jgi:hypothetical protein
MGPSPLSEAGRASELGQEVVQVRGSLGARLGIVRELMGFLWTQKLWWMIPLVVMLLIIGALVALASATTLAPFIYPLI